MFSNFDWESFLQFYMIVTAGVVICVDMFNEINDRKGGKK